MSGVRFSLAGWGMLFLVAAAWPVRAPAQEAGADHHRWGVGWDSGFTVHCRLSPAWGLGVRLDPDLTEWGLWDDNWQEDDQDNPGPERQGASEDERDSRHYGAGVILYRESRFGRWMGIGPYVGLSYGYDTSSWMTTDITTWGSGADQTNRIFRSDERSVGRTWTLEMGVRPTFTFHERFLLETRFGVGVTYTSTDRDWIHTETRQDVYEESSQSWGDHLEDTRWQVDVFGEKLGPGAVVRFVVFL